MRGSKDHVDFDLNLLNALDALLQEQNVTRAAERAGMSQPAMSRSLSRLRRLLKDGLLVRIGNTLHPTPYASNLIGPVHELMERIDHLAEYRPHFDPSTDAHQFNIAATDYAMLMVIQPFTRYLEEEARHISLRVSFANADAFEQVQHGDVDLVLGPVSNSDILQSHVLLEDRLMCVTWGANTVSAENMSMEEFLKTGHCTIKPGAYCYSAAERRNITSLGLSESPSTAMAVGSVLIPFLLAGTHYVSLIPEGIGKRLGSLLPLHMSEPPFPVESMALGMTWHARSTSDPAHTWLREQLIEIAKQAAEECYED
jgi:DNA-binding transcriptional LysR family regulator